MMCPAQRFVDRRMQRVKGRIRKLNSSIRGRMTNNHKGAPYGMRCLTKLMYSLIIRISTTGMK